MTSPAPAPGGVDPISPGEPRCWTFTVPTPAGDVRSTYQLTRDALEFESDALMDGGRVTLPWSTIVEAGTAVLGLPVGRGAPDLGRFVPGTLEWLVARRSDRVDQPFMRRLPPSPDRDALIAAVRERIGTRWVGESMPFTEARQRFGVSSGSFGGLKVAGLVVAVLALLVLLLYVVLLLSSILLFPAGFALGLWLFRSGLIGLRNALSVANTPTARISSAAIGLVELEGAARTTAPSPAGVTGRPSVWWDISVEAWSYDSDQRHNSWRQVAARHGGTIDVVEIEDQTGRVPILLKGADLLLAAEQWDGSKDSLPPAGAALLNELGFPWRDKLRVTETRLEVDAPVYVLGTLAERSTIPRPGEEGLVERITAMVRTGEWRTRLIRILPRSLGLVVAVLTGFLGIVTGVGRGGERVKGPQHSEAPDLPPHAVLVWKGRAGQPFIVSNRREAEALTQLRTRSLCVCAGGMVVLCFCVYQLIQMF